MQASSCPRAMHCFGDHLLTAVGAANSFRREVLGIVFDFGVHCTVPCSIYDMYIRACDAGLGERI
jgi:hypothetical protein